MTVLPIRTDEEHKAALREIEHLWGAKASTPESAQLIALAAMVETYESDRWPIEKRIPNAKTRAAMEEGHAILLARRKRD